MCRRDGFSKRQERVMKTTMFAWALCATVGLSGSALAETVGRWPSDTGGWVGAGGSGDGGGSGGVDSATIGATDGSLHPSDDTSGGSSATASDGCKATPGAAPVSLLAALALLLALGPRRRAR
jgi:uncharacterized protein (TIGR03382 family)